MSQAGLNFKEAKDEFLKWAVPGLLTALVWVSWNNNTIVTTLVAKQSAGEERTERIATYAKETRALVETHGRHLPVIEIKVFGQVLTL